MPDHLAAAARQFRHHRRVFVAPPWREIYTNDSERNQDFTEAVRTHDAMVTAYTQLPQLGYELSALPLGDVATRRAFVERMAI